MSKIAYAIVSTAMIQDRLRLSAPGINVYDIVHSPEEDAYRITLMGDGLPEICASQPGTKVTLHFSGSRDAVEVRA
jgi:hypothetical protein